MKKIIKATPLLSGALAVSAPIITLTSCSENYYEKFTYVFDTQHPAKDFTPHDKSSLKEATMQEANDELFNAFAKHKNILADQIIYDMTHTIGSVLTPSNGNFVGQMDVYVGKVNTETHTISFKLDVDIVGINDGLNYQFSVKCTNWRQYVWFSPEDHFNQWMCANENVYFSDYLELDSDWPWLLKAYFRYHWAVSFDMNAITTQKFINRSFKFDIPYVGPLSFDMDTNNFDLYGYVDACCNIQQCILGQQDPQAYYLSDVKFIEG